jgi:hypothetical protein
MFSTPNSPRRMIDVMMSADPTMENDEATT